MYKKISFKEMEKLVDAEITTSIAESIQADIDAAKIEIAYYKPILISKFIKNGKDIVHCYCSECKTEWEEEKTGYYYRMKCPDCGNTAVVEARPFSSLRNIGNNYVVIGNVDKEKGYILFYLFKPVLIYDMNGYNESQVNEMLAKSNFDFLKGSFKPTINTRDVKVIVFIPGKGLRLKREYDRSFFATTNNIAKNAIEMFSYAELVDNKNLADAISFLEDNGISVSSGNVINAINDNINSLEKAKELRKTTKAKKPAEYDEYIKYEPKKFDIEAAKKMCLKPIIVLCTQMGTKKNYNRYCPHCGTVSNGEVETNRENSRFICPNCGKENVVEDTYYYNHGRLEKNFTIFELMDETNDLIVRRFCLKEEITGAGSFSCNVTETNRFFFTNKKCYAFEIINGVIKKTTAYALDFGYYYNNRNFLMQSNEEIIDIISKSSIKYIGVKEAWGFNDENPNHKIENFGSINRSSYIYTWYKRPYIEQLIKTGLYRATADAISFDADQIQHYVNTSGTTVYNILNITKPVFKIAREKNLDLRAIKTLKSLWDFDHTITGDVYDALKDIGDINLVSIVSREYNIPFSKIIEYLNSCYNNQCIQKTEALRIWADYLRMAKDMTYRLDNKNTKFPQSLKKEHDRAVFSYRVVQDEINKKRFIEQAKINEKYEYSFGNLFVKIPKTPEEIIEEGTNQKHCVASYVNRVREGDTVVAFIRKKEFPNESYFTIEIRDETIIQVKGYTNCAPTDKTLLEFIDKYAKARNLKKNYR